ncbi:MAG: hypothetical protein MI741_10450 [Rhodospirillales bacterium]|nr:hypothetical protein [Rhodospirillales bacterium]
MSNLAGALAAVLCAAALLITGCAGNVNVAQPGGDGGSEERVPGFTTFPDIPMPLKGEIDMDKTLIFGTGDSWFGRLVVNAPHSAGDMFDFYRNGLPGLGWQEITAVRASASVLTYSRNERIATIQIESATIRGSISSITISPRGLPATVPSAASAPAAAPIAPVQRVQ